MQTWQTMVEDFHFLMMMSCTMQLKSPRKWHLYDIVFVFKGNVWLSYIKTFFLKMNPFFSFLEVGWLWLSRWRFGSHFSWSKYIFLTISWSIWYYSSHIFLDISSFHSFCWIWTSSLKKMKPNLLSLVVPWWLICEQLNKFVQSSGFF